MQFQTIPSRPAHGTPEKPESRLSSLPPFSAAATKLIQCSERRDADLRTIQPVLASDPALAADVLRLANSPLFAIRTEIRSIEHAVVFLGLERLKALAAAVALGRYSQGVDERANRRCWEHGLSCAVVAEELAGSFDVRPEDAYTAGLLHDIGRIGLLKAYAKEYVSVLQTGYQSVEESVLLEQSLLKTDHCHSGAFLTKVWGLPRYLQLIIETHHSANTNGSNVARVIRAACAMADALGYAEVEHKNTAIADAMRLLEDPVAARFTARLSAVEKRTQDRIAYFCP